MAAVEIETADEKAAATEVAPAEWDCKSGDSNVPAPYDGSDGGRHRGAGAAFLAACSTWQALFQAASLSGLRLYLFRMMAFWRVMTP